MALQHRGLRRIRRNHFPPYLFRRSLALPAYVAIRLRHPTQVLQVSRQGCAINCYR